MAISRRSLVFAPALAAQSRTLSAADVVERIKKGVAVPWRAETVDTFKSGGPDTSVTGIATTFMATLDVLQRAAAGRMNMVITHEPTFYTHNDSIKDLSADPTFLAKQRFIEKNNIVIFRFHDHWHARRPDGVRAGMLAQLRWQEFDRPDSGYLELPLITLNDLAKTIKERLKIRSIRVIGDPHLPVSRVALNPGYASLQGGIRALNLADVLVLGEAREWEVYEYAQDMIAAGKKKALIVLGHAISEEGGMEECARWLKTLVPEVKVAHIAAGEPFWSV